MLYPNYIPSTRRYVHGDWPVKRHRFMANTEQRILHADTKAGKELRLGYANLPTEQIQDFLFHYDAVLGNQAPFQLPPEVFGGWVESKLIFGSDNYWRYKEPPRITNQRGLYATIELTLKLATGDAGYLGPLPDVQTPTPSAGEDYCEELPIALPPYDPPPPGVDSGNNPGDPDDDPEPTPNPGPIGPIGPTPTPIPGPGGGSGDGGGGGTPSSPSPDWLDPEDHTPPDEDVLWFPPEFDELGRAALYQYTFIVSATRTNSGTRRCFDDFVNNEGGAIRGGGNGDKIFIKRSFQAYAVQMFLGVGNELWQCESPGNALVACWVKFNRVIRTVNNDLAWTWYTQGDSYYNSNGTFDPNYETTRKWSTGCPDGGIRVATTYSSPEYGSRLGINYWAENPTLVERELVTWNVVNDPTIPEAPEGPLLSPFTGPGPETGTAQSRTASSRSYSTAANTDVFPAVYPQTRNYTTSDWNTRRYDGSISRQPRTMALPSAGVASDGKLQLTFANRGDAVAKKIMDHYHACTGTWQSFILSAEILADWDSVHRDSLANAEWIYDAPPQVTSAHPGTSTTTVRLAVSQYSSKVELADGTVIDGDSPEGQLILGCGDVGVGGDGSGVGSGGGGTDPTPTPIPEPTPGPDPTPTPIPDPTPIGPIGPTPTPEPGPGPPNTGGGGEDERIDDPYEEEVRGGCGVWLMEYAYQTVSPNRYQCPDTRDPQQIAPNGGANVRTIRTGMVVGNEAYPVCGINFFYYGTATREERCNLPDNFETRYLWAREAIYPWGTSGIVPGTQVSEGSGGQGIRRYYDLEAENQYTQTFFLGRAKLTYLGPTNDPETGQELSYSEYQYFDEHNTNPWRVEI